jgi:hypothetical protein
MVWKTDEDPLVYATDDDTSRFYVAITGLTDVQLLVVVFGCAMGLAIWQHRNRNRRKGYGGGLSLLPTTRNNSGPNHAPDWAEEQQRVRLRQQLEHWSAGNKRARDESAMQALF